MAYLDTQIKKHRLSDCIPTQGNGERMIQFPLNGNSDDCSYNCFLKAVRVGPRMNLLSRVSYLLPRAVPATASDALRYADEVNGYLKYSEVFVVKDIDGDGHHYLRMDTILQDTFDRESISGFLDCITEDVSVLLDYFNCGSSGSLSPADSASFVNLPVMD